MARAKRPATSTQAFNRSQNYSATVERAALVAINKGMNDGRGGVTCDEAEVLTGTIHQSMSAAFNHLKAVGVIETFGPTRRTRTGSMAEVYRLALVAKDRAQPEQQALDL